MALAPDLITIGKSYCLKVNPVLGSMMLPARGNMGEIWLVY